MVSDVFKYSCMDRAFLQSSEKVQTILSHIVDDNSQKIFLNCLLYSLTNDLIFIRKNILKTSVGRRLYEFLGSSSRPLVVYGAGRRGQRLVDTFPELKWQGFVDAKGQGAYRGMPILSKEDSLHQWEDALYVISMLSGYEDVEKCPLGGGMITLERENMELQKLQYVEEDHIPYHELQSWIDAGAYDGIDTEKFLAYGNTKKVFLFEPDEDMYRNCQRRFAKDSRVDLYPYALHDSEGKTAFSVQSGGLSSLRENGEKTVQLKRLDDIVDGDVDFIKMDVEGNEYKALVGAKNLIKRCRPYMAISVYHRPEDIVELPWLLLQYNNDYRFSFKHYSIGQVDTVMYVF